MFDYVPEMFAGDHADSIEESDQWVEEVVSGKLATVRRPPELLTRDVVAKAINSEVKAGRGSPHGGAFLDISHRGEEAILKKLPSMHHQFKELAGVDISKEPMEVGPTAHYVMGGVCVDAESQETTVPGLFACGEVASGLHGANRLGGNSLSDLIVFGKRAGEYAAKRAKDLAQPTIDEAQVGRAIDDMMAPLLREGGENPGLIYDEMRDMMQSKVGIIRTKSELEEALEDIKSFKQRALCLLTRVRSKVQLGMAPGSRPDQHGRRLPCSHAGCDHPRGESRWTHSRRFPNTGRRLLGQDPEHHLDGERRNENSTRARRAHARRPQGRINGSESDDRRASRRSRRCKLMSLKGTTQSFTILRGEGDEAELEAYELELDEGMVVLDCLHRIQHEQEPDMAVRWNCKAGKCGSCSAEINGRPRLMCMTRMSDVVAETPAGQPIEIRPMKTFPHVKDLRTDVSWNYEVAQRIAPINGPETMDWEFNQMEADRVQHFRECIECFLCVNTCHVLRDHELFDDFAGPRNLVRLAQYEMHPLDVEDRVPEIKKEFGVEYCNITRCCTEVCPAGIQITDDAIIQPKERVVDRYYDPLQRIWRTLTRQKVRY